MRTVSRTTPLALKSRGACSVWRGSAGASPAMIASTDTASTISPLPCIKKENRWR